MRAVRPGKNKPESADVHAAARVNQTENTRTVNPENETPQESPDEKRSRTAEGTDMKRPKTLMCPVCNHAMSREKIVSVEIDRCNQCGGIFLDKGELQVISGYDLKISGKQSSGSTNLIYTPHGLSRHVRPNYNDEHEMES